MQGTRILDLSTGIGGAYAARLLATTGAEVVVGEPAGGSPLRDSPPLIATPSGTRSALWEYLGAYKRSIELEADQLLAVAGDYDVVVLACDDGPNDWYGPLGPLARELRRHRPGLVVIALTPYGLTGPQSHWRAGPLELWAAGGHLMLNGEADREPIPGGGPWDSYLVGATAAVAAQAALLEARASATGALIDIGALETLASTHQWSISLYTHAGVVKRRTGNRHGEMHHPLALYECRDGWACIAAATFQQWEGLCIAMDQVELLADDGLANAADRFDRADELDRLVTKWSSHLTVDEVVRACQDHFCPAGPVRELTDVIVDEQLAFRHYWMQAPHLGAGVVMPGPPFALPSTPAFTPAPARSSARAVESPVTPAAGLPPTPQGNQQADRRFRPLAGVRVVELTISWAGPLACRFLADLGAEVVKVEHPTSRGVAVTPPDPDADPEPWQWGQLPPTSVRNGMYPDADPGDRWWNRMSLWNKMNRSKRSLCLDIKAPGGREVFERLVASADIVINNYSPRGVRSLGIDHETLRAIKPDVVTVAMSGYGATGPGSEAVSWGPILDASSGLAATTGYPDSGPYKQGLAYPDPVGGTHGAVAVLAAWWDHLRSGEAVHVDLSQLETLLTVAGELVIETSATGHPPPRRGARSAAYAPAGVYRCQGDDRWLCLSVHSDADWSRLADLIPALDQPQWRGLDGRRAGHDEIDRVISAWTQDRAPREAVMVLQDAGLAAALASTNQDLVEDPQLAARGFMVEVDQPGCGPRPYPGSPFLVDGRPLGIGPAATLGADNDLLLEELGFDRDRREDLARTGTVATAPPS